MKKYHLSDLLIIIGGVLLSFFSMKLGMHRLKLIEASLDSIKNSNDSLYSDTTITITSLLKDSTTEAIGHMQYWHGPAAYRTNGKWKIIDATGALETMYQYLKKPVVLIYGSDTIKYYPGDIIRMKP